MFSLPVSPSLGWQDGLGIAIWAIGFAIEFVADMQKFNFKNDPENKKRMCTVGLWSVSRHPNYFGEALCWWGIWSMCTAAFDANNRFMYFSIFSPIYVGVILLFLSGVPTLEIPWDKKYGRDPEYRAYKKSVPPFVLFFPSLYVAFPKILKLAFCCEVRKKDSLRLPVSILFLLQFPFYWKEFPSDDDSASVTSRDERDNNDLEKGWERSSVSYQK